MCTTCINIEQLKFSLYSSTRDEARVPCTANLTYSRLNHVEGVFLHLTQLGFCAGLPPNPSHASLFATCLGLDLHHANKRTICRVVRESGPRDYRLLSAAGRLKNYGLLHDGLFLPPSR